MAGYPEKWLVWRLSALGDVVLTTGVLDHWHRERGWRFHVATKAGTAPVFAGSPTVEKVISPSDEDLRMPGLWRWLRSLAEEYRGWGLIDLHGTFRSRLLGALWHGPVARYPKKGLARRVFLASGGRFCGDALRAATVPMRYSMAVDATPPPASRLLPKIWLFPEELQAARALLNGIFSNSALSGGALPGRNFSGSGAPVAMHPYATHALKAWPAGHWRRLAALLDGAGVPWIVLGKGEPLFPGDPRDITNTTSLRESCAALSLCRTLVTGDSGPMHLAAAVGTPVVALFGPTVREWGFFPAGERDTVLQRETPCRPCSLHGKHACPHGGNCLSAITPEDVFQALF